MYTPIVGDKQSIACRNDDNGVQLLRDSSFETRRNETQDRWNKEAKEGRAAGNIQRRKRVIWKPRTNDFRLENNTENESNEASKIMMEIVIYKAYLHNFFLPRSRLIINNHNREWMIDNWKW